jgi:hypothetical protein
MGCGTSSIKVGMPVAHAGAVSEESPEESPRIQTEAISAAERTSRRRASVEQELEFIDGSMSGMSDFSDNDMDDVGDSNLSSADADRALVHSWLKGVGMEQYFDVFWSAGYTDMVRCTIFVSFMSVPIRIRLIRKLAGTAHANAGARYLHNRN